MKKIFSIGVAALLVVGLVTGAMAIGPGGGFGGGPGGGCRQCCDCGQDGTVTPEQSQKMLQFQKEIQPLREKMFALKTQMMELRAQVTPDLDVIAAKQKEMIDIRTEIRKKASSSGVSSLMQGKGGCWGDDCGYGCGNGKKPFKGKGRTAK